MRVKLYHYPATRSARILWLLYELAPSIEFSLERIDLYRGDQYSAEFEDRFPFHALPAADMTLADGQAMSMTESGAIVVAIADQFPDHALAPSPAPFTPERADYLQMIHICGATIDMMLWQIRIHKHVLPDKQRDPATVERYHHKFKAEAEPFLKSRLQVSHFICGDRFTAADCMVGHVVVWARHYGLCAGDPFDRYLERLASRPAYGKAFSDIAELKQGLPSDSPVKTFFTG